MPVRDTSTTAWREVGQSIKDLVRSRMINFGGVMTRRELAQELQVLPGSIPAAVNALMDEGFLIEMGDKCKCGVSGRMVHGIKRNQSRINDWRDSGKKAEEILAHG